MLFGSLLRTVGATFGAAIALCFCTHGTPQHRFDLITPPPPAQLTIDKITRLNQAINNDPQKAELTRDVRLMLEALRLQETELHSEAVGAWKKAAQFAQHGFREVALRGWIDAYCQTLKEPITSKVFSDIVRAEFQSTPISKLMQDSSEQALGKNLRIWVPNCISDKNSAGHSRLEKPIVTPTEGIPAEDISLVQTAIAYCESDNRLAAPWSSWISSLPQFVRSYWRALVLLCQQQQDVAIALLEKTYNKLENDPQHIIYAYFALQQLADIHQQEADIQRAAHTYLRIMRLWQSGAIKSENLKISVGDFYWQASKEARIASRARALLGDWEHSKIFADFAQKALTRIRVETPEFETESGHSLADAQAEVKDMTASVIGIGQGNLRSAAALYQTAIADRSLPKPWRIKFLRKLALLHFMLSEYRQSIKYWHRLSADGNQELGTIRSYWIARAESELGSPDLARRRIETLIRNSPFSYYTIMSLTTWPELEALWHEELRSLLNQTKSTEASLEDLKEQADLNQLVAHELAPRAEILIQSGILEWARIATDDIARAMVADQTRKPSKAALVYLSRLHHLTGQHSQAIKSVQLDDSFIKKVIQKWPEHLFALFPRPYKEQFFRSATEHNLDEELLFAIARNASFFDPNKRLNQERIGMMQLPKTLLPWLSAQLQLSSDHLDERVAQPGFNIELGAFLISTLLAQHDHNLPKALFFYQFQHPIAENLKILQNPKDPALWVEFLSDQSSQAFITGVLRDLPIYRLLSEYTKQNAQVQTTHRILSERSIRFQ